MYTLLSHISQNEITMIHITILIKDFADAIRGAIFPLATVIMFLFHPEICLAVKPADEMMKK